MRLGNRIQMVIAQNGTFVALVVLIAVFATINPRFFTFQNGETILLQAAELGVVALPLAILVMAGAIDLSVGSVASVAAVTAGMVMVQTGEAWLGVLSGLAFGAFAGLVNGVLVAYVGLNPLVVTLGFLSVWGGTALYLTNGQTIAGLPQAFRSLGTMSLGPFPIQIIVLIVAVIGWWFVLNVRPFGRKVLATGGNARAARLMGVNVRGVTLRLFVLTGVSAALAGIMLAAKLQSAGPSVGAGLEIQALTVVLLGGVAFEGGSGRISGILAGLLFVGVLRNGLVIVGVSQFLQTIIIGATLVLAISLDKSIQNILKRLWTRAARAESTVATSTIPAPDPDPDPDSAVDHASSSLDSRIRT